MTLSLALFLAGCGYPSPRKIPDKPGHYRLQYCSNESDCFNAAKKTCPEGYRITKFRSGPEEFVCE